MDGGLATWMEGSLLGWRISYLDEGGVAAWMEGSLLGWRISYLDGGLATWMKEG